MITWHFLKTIVKEDLDNKNSLITMKPKKKKKSRKRKRNSRMKI